MPTSRRLLRQARATRTDDRTARPGTHAVLARSDWTALGWTDAAVRHRVGQGLWRRLHRGVVHASATAPDFAARVRGAWLAGGRGAVVGGRAAAHALGLDDQEPVTVEVQVPHGRTPAHRAGIRFRHVRRIRESILWDSVRVTTVEETVLDLVGDASSPAVAARWVEQACSRRLTSPQRLLEALAHRRRLRHRGLVLAMCVRVDSGETSWLEGWYARRVARDHGLPPGRRQVRHRVAGRITYADVELDEYGVVIELDGRLGHEDPAGRHRDMVRDNAGAVEGRVTLRYGWRDATGSPCAVAGQIARVLRDRGWTGELSRCGPDCGLPAAPDTTVVPVA